MKPADDPTAAELSWDAWTGQLSPSMAKEAELSQFQMDQLVSLNDYDGQTFQQIADFVEANL